MNITFVLYSGLEKLMFHQEQNWNPQNCEICLQFKEDYTLMSTEDRNIALKSLRWMLKRMQANFSTREFTWDFMDARDNFLERL